MNDRNRYIPDHNAPRRTITPEEARASGFPIGTEVTATITTEDLMASGPMLLFKPRNRRVREAVTDAEKLQQAVDRLRVIDREISEMVETVAPGAEHYFAAMGRIVTNALRGFKVT